MSELTDESVRTDLAEQAATIVARYPEGRSRSALLPMLHLVQSVDGYVSPAGIAFCAEQLGITKAEVAAVATFYTMYKRRPTGEYLVSVCTNTMCGVLGGDKAYEALAEYLGVGHDQTTDDGRITLEHAECLAACDYAPVMTVNYEYFDQVDADSALTLVKQLQDGERPVPTRGARLCSFKEMSRQLAGFTDSRSAVADPMTAVEPTVAGNRIAEERGVSVPGYYPNTPIPKKAEKAGGAEKGAKPAPTKAAPKQPPAAAAAPAAASPATGSAAAASAATAPAAPESATTAPASAGTPSADKAETPADKAAVAATDEGPKTAEPAGDAAAPTESTPPTASTPPAAIIPAQSAESDAAASAEPAASAAADSDPAPAPAKKAAPRKRATSASISATAEAPKRRAAAKTTKAPSKRTTTRRPGTERSAPAVEQADATPAQATVEPQVKDVETPRNAAETSPTVPEPAADSKPAGDAPPTDPRTENAEGNDK